MSLSPSNPTRPAQARAGYQPEPPVVEVFSEDFDTEAEADAFAQGVEWGEEPLFIVESILPVANGTRRFYRVTFAYATDLEDAYMKDTYGE
jgi:hypothetical protein